MIFTLSIASIGSTGFKASALCSFEFCVCVKDWDKWTKWILYCNDLLPSARTTWLKPYAIRRFELIFEQIEINASKWILYCNDLFTSARTTWLKPCGALNWFYWKDWDKCAKMNNDYIVMICFHLRELPDSRCAALWIDFWKDWDKCAKMTIIFL